MGCEFGPFRDGPVFKPMGYITWKSRRRRRFRFSFRFPQKLAGYDYYSAAVLLRSLGKKKNTAAIATSYKYRSEPGSPRTNEETNA